MVALVIKGHFRGEHFLSFDVRSDGSFIFILKSVCVYCVCVCVYIRIKSHNNSDTSTSTHGRRDESYASSQDKSMKMYSYTFLHSHPHTLVYTFNEKRTCHLMKATNTKMILPPVLYGTSRTHSFGEKIHDLLKTLPYILRL